MNLAKRRQSLSAEKTWTAEESRRQDPVVVMSMEKTVTLLCSRCPVRLGPRLPVHQREDGLQLCDVSLISELLRSAIPGFRSNSPDKHVSPDYKTNSPDYRLDSLDNRPFSPDLDSVM